MKTGLWSDVVMPSSGDIRTGGFRVVVVEDVDVVVEPVIVVLVEEVEVEPIVEVLDVVVVEVDVVLVDVVVVPS